MRRFDVYGFRDPCLEGAAEHVRRALGVELALRDSSYRGLYYCAGEGVANDYLLHANGEGSRWRLRYPEQGAILMVNDLPGMDEIREKLAAREGGPVFLESILVPDEDDDEEDEEEDDPAAAT